MASKLLPLTSLPSLPSTSSLPSVIHQAPPGSLHLFPLLTPLHCSVRHRPGSTGTTAPPGLLHQLRPLHRDYDPGDAFTNSSRRCIALSRRLLLVQVRPAGVGGSLTHKNGTGRCQTIPMVDLGKLKAKEREQRRKRAQGSHPPLLSNGKRLKQHQL
ncbi:hypothetical protein V2J09_015522 [Rumex salicifolius]